MIIVNERNIYIHACVCIYVLGRKTSQQSVSLVTLRTLYLRVLTYLNIIPTPAIKHSPFPTKLNLVRLNQPHLSFTTRCYLHFSSLARVIQFQMLLAISIHWNIKVNWELFPPRSGTNPHDPRPVTWIIFLMVWPMKMTPGLRCTAGWIYFDGLAQKLGGGYYLHKACECCMLLMDKIRFISLNMETTSKCN